MKSQLERIAVVLTPLVFAPLASFIAAFVASNFPGLPHVTPTEITGVEVTAFVTAGGLVYKWLHGRQILMTLKPDVNKALVDLGLNESQVSEVGKLIEARVGPAVQAELTKRLTALTAAPQTAPQQ